MKDAVATIDVEMDPMAIGRLRTLGGEGLLSKMIDLFLEHSPRRIQAAHEGRKAGNWYEVERAAHSMKSSAANLGLTGLQGLAREIEELSIHQEAGRVDPLLGEIESIFPAIRVRLEEIRNGGSSKS